MFFFKKTVTDHSIHNFFRCPTLAHIENKRPEQDPERDILIQEALQFLGIKEHQSKQSLTKKNLSTLVKSNNRYCFISSRLDLTSVHTHPDIIVIQNGRISMYQVNLGYHPLTIEKTVLAVSAYLLDSLGYHVSQIQLLGISKDKYKLKRQLFYRLNLKSLLPKRFSHIARAIERIRKGKKSKPLLDRHCFKPYACNAFGNCWENGNGDIFDLFQLPLDEKLSYHRHNVQSYDDIQDASLTLSKTQEHQIEVEQSGKAYINKEALRAFMKQIKYPLYCFDIEAAQFVKPLFKDATPFSYVPFLYSVHECDSQFNVVGHSSDFFSFSSNLRREFAESLIKTLSKAKCIVVFDVTLEKGILNELIALFPDLAKDLGRIRDNFLDISPLFTERHLILPGMKGKCSLKSVLPCIDSNLHYKNLDVQSGFDAVFEYKRLCYSKNIDKNTIQKELVNYCKRDTHALVVLLKCLQRFSEKT